MGWPARPAAAEVTIHTVIVDDEELRFDTGVANAVRPPIRIPSTARRIEFRFGGSGDDNDSETAGVQAEESSAPRATRLKYRLEGVEPDWRDIPAGARVLLRIVDSQNGAVASEEALLEGQSPGWRGAPETSPFVRQTLSAVAPATAQTTGVNFLSSNGDAIVGMIGIDDVQFSIESRAANASRQQPLPIVSDLETFRPDTRPEGWERSGTRLDLTRLGLRPVPRPHAILVIADDDPTRYGGWTTKNKIAVEPGDRVTVSWLAAWSLGVGGKTRAEYRDVKPGVYTFRVGAFRPGGEPAGVETSLEIEVYVPFHLRRDVWAAAAALGLTAAITAGRAATLRRMKRRLADVEREHALERERARIARDLHDDVGAGLTEIAMQAEWVRGEVEGVASPEALALTDNIRRSADELVRSIDAIVWAVNPANDTLERFAVYIVQTTEQFLDAAGLSMRFDIPADLPPLPLEGAIRHRLFLALREAVHNAVKHAAATAVTVSLGMRDGRLELTIADDGCGFDPAAVSRVGQQDGLNNMRERMKELGGSCEIDSRLGSGTRVHFTVPLPQPIGSRQHA